MKLQVERTIQESRDDCSIAGTIITLVWSLSTQIELGLEGI